MHEDRGLIVQDLLSSPPAVDYVFSYHTALYRPHVMTDDDDDDDDDGLVSEPKALVQRCKIYWTVSSKNAHM
ncbi:hypothetical protein [Absidia glauca]|uniref:Uncharacterized protein n=1 Tax=Absidia glauca TaxID=4829 RepID=A0A168KYY7_ABSGL|nr:hypothetical protein [Absidia glauca]